jgi:hypothetical protein
MSHAHLRLHGLKIIRLAGLSLSAHALSGPLFKTTNPLVHVHVVKNNRNQRLWARKTRSKGSNDKEERQGKRRLGADRLNHIPVHAIMIKYLNFPKAFFSFFFFNSLHVLFGQCMQSIEWRIGLLHNVFISINSSFYLNTNTVDKYLGPPVYMWVSYRYIIPSSRIRID